MEIIPGIHDGCINLETWNVHPDVDISNLDLVDKQFPDNGVIGNTELELSIETAEHLIEVLKAAVHQIKTGDGT